MIATLARGCLTLSDRATLAGLGESFSLEAGDAGPGAFLRAQWSPSQSYRVLPAGQLEGLERFTATHRYEPFWMRPAAGRTHAEVPAETQWLLAQVSGGDYVLLVPLFDDTVRFALHGDETGLHLTAETGDPYAPTEGGLALYVARGEEPYSLLRDAARAVARRLGSVPRRVEKTLPEFAHLFGWCTWDAFYQDVDPSGVKRGLESFAAGGVEPRYLILDDGWQSTARRPTGETRLTSFAPNEKFGGELASLVRVAKEQFKIQHFLVWHAILGYWGGVDGEALPGYDVRDTRRSFGVGVLKHEPHMNVQWWGNVVGLVAPEQIGRFYDDYHRLLAAQGIAGVKVDVQAMLEGVACGHGGRVSLNRAFRAALEDSTHRHFGGRLINCMSHAQETFYGSPRSTLIRTSTDFWPRRPETHGLHLYTNAQVGAWFGEFMHPDWDMFQSGHEWGAYHAAGRAVSGAPIYVSDKPGTHDFGLLRQLVCSDGSALLADDPGRPTVDCLFCDPTRQPVPLKIFNRNGPRGVVGLFNAQYHPEHDKKVTVDGTVAPADVPTLEGPAFAAFAQRSGRVWQCGRDDVHAVRLAEREWEIVSYAPITRGVAVIGLADKLNSGGAIIAERWRDEQTLEVELRDGGELLGWSQHAPRAVEAGGIRVAHTFDPASGTLRATSRTLGRQTVVIRR